MSRAPSCRHIYAHSLSLRVNKNPTETRKRAPTHGQGVYLGADTVARDPPSFHSTVFLRFLQ